MAVVSTLATAKATESEALPGDEGLKEILHLLNEQSENMARRG